MFTLGMAATLFMAGMELNFKHIRGMPLFLALRGWGLSLIIGVALAALLYATPLARSPLMLTLALCTTALGTLLPMLRDGGQLHTPFGRLFVAAGTVGEVGPIVAMSLLLSQEYSTWQEAGFLLLFLGLVMAMAAAGMGLRPAPVVALLTRTLHASTQLPVRLALFLMAGYFVLTEEFGFENILGAFAAGMVVGLATQRQGGQAAAPQDRRGVLRLVHSLLLRRHRRQVAPRRLHPRPDHRVAGCRCSWRRCCWCAARRPGSTARTWRRRSGCPSRCIRRWPRCRWWW